MNLPSDPTTWDNIAKICRRADEYLEKHYSEEDTPKPKKRKNFEGEYGNFADIHHSILGGK